MKNLSERLDKHIQRLQEISTLAWGKAAVKSLPKRIGAVVKKPFNKNSWSRLGRANRIANATSSVASKPGGKAFLKNNSANSIKKAVNTKLSVIKKAHPVLAAGTSQI